MKKNIQVLIYLCILSSLPCYAGDNTHYYFKTLDIQNGLSQNTVNTILQDKQGFMWFGTQDALNRYDGLSFRIFKREDGCGLGNNFITVLHEDEEGYIWIGTGAGVYIYNPVLESITAFDMISDTGDSISRNISMIDSDENGNVWIASNDEGFFKYNRQQKSLHNYLPDKELENVTYFWFEGKTCWLSLYGDNLYQTDIDFKSPLVPFKDINGNEVFKDCIIYAQVQGPHNCVYVGSLKGLTEINLTTRKTRHLLDAYVRTLQFNSDMELWAGTETGVYIYDLAKDKKRHVTMPYQDDPYALSDNAIYALYKDKEQTMWIGSYFGGVNYYPYQWTYFEKFYSRDDIRNFGKRVREFCAVDDGTLWIGTEDKGLFHFDPESGKIAPFEHPLIYKNIHGLCHDGDYLWVGTFSGGLNKINLHTKQVTHYQKGEDTTSLSANDVFDIYKTTTGKLLVGTTSGLLSYNQSTDNFTRIPQFENIFIYHILEDFNGNIWIATYSNGVFRYDATSKTWKNFVWQANDSTSLPGNKVISIYEDSQKRLWFMTQGAGFCRFDLQTETFVRYDMSHGYPSNVIFKMIEESEHKLWITTSNGLVCFNPKTNNKHLYTTANGLLSNQFNYQSGYRDPKGRIYFGSINGFIAFDPKSFSENTFIPPVVITDFFLFNKRYSVGSQGSPLKQSITYADVLELDAEQNSFSFHVAALSYLAPEMNQLLYKLEGFDAEWYPVGRTGVINYSNLPYGDYLFRLKGSNSDGKWNEAGRVLKIRINPPFYLSPWAYIIYVALIILSIISIFYKLRERTNRKHAREMERFEQEKERELYGAKIDFFTNVAHEIRTPLTLIKSPLENVLNSANLSNKVKDDLEIMNLNTNRLLDLVNQLLDFRKTERQGFQLNLADCDVVDILQSIYKRFTLLARQKELDFTLDCPEVAYTSVDREEITKIISNLLTNAVKYAATYIRVRMLLSPDSLQLSVCNDGPVIPLNMREEIFKPFIQYQSGALRSVSGTGIGLALARSLAELHGGKLSMDNSEDCNCFVLTLPVKSVNKEKTVPDVAVIPEALPLPEEELPGQHHHTLLLVEDNPEMLAFVMKQLYSDYGVLTASNGKEALNVLKENTVNLVVSDIMMPEMDGLELCDYLKSELDYSHIPIILLTAKTTLQAKIEGMKSGADAYIEKPFSVEYLKVCISNLLSNREKLRASFANSPFVQANTMAMTKADETFLKKLNEIVVANMQNPDFCLDNMASLLNMSRSSLNRKIKGVLDMTPNDYIRLERLKKAAQLMQEGDCMINEICYMVGFNTPSYFTKCFQKQFGILPKDFVK